MREKICFVMHRSTGLACVYKANQTLFNLSKEKSRYIKCHQKTKRVTKHSLLDDADVFCAFIAISTEFQECSFDLEHTIVHALGHIVLSAY